MLPGTLRLSDYGLGQDDRARQPQPIASQFGDRFLPWELHEDMAQFWEERRRHVEHIRTIRSRFAPRPAAAAATAWDGLSVAAAPRAGGPPQPELIPAPRMVLF